MINVVYLVLVLVGGSGQMTSVSIPQANMKQCQINAKAYSNKVIAISEHRNSIKLSAECIVGVK